jgi:xylulose-5-phosphate/fructose-6-phosphate phosphoketolase
VDDVGAYEPPLSDAEREDLDRWWRAANYLALGQTYLMDNPLLSEALSAEQIKPTLLGHWGSAPGLNFVWAHLNRVIRQRDLDMVVVFGPGHCGHAMIAGAYLDGTYSEVYPDVSLDEEGLLRLFKQFSFPGGVPSHAAPETPGSFHEGGELGYSLLHGFGAVFDNPDLIAAVVVSDGEAETGPLAASWHSNKFLNPARDGAVLPILHLNGYKIAMPTVLARIGEEDLDALLRGYGWDPITVEGDDPARVHVQMAAALDRSLDGIAAIQRAARHEGATERPRWPMIVLRTPAGWTAPKEVHGKPAEGTWRCHLTPLEHPRSDPEERAILEQWLRSYRPEELFDAGGAPVADIRALAPAGDRRLSANPHTNGGRSPRPLRRPDVAAYGVALSAPGSVDAEATRVLSAYLRDVLVRNPDRLRIFGPDETSSNRLSHLYEVTEHAFVAERAPTDEDLGPDGRIMDVLSEHLCQGWLEGYLLTGRHGVLNTYEAFAHVVDEQ